MAKESRAGCHHLLGMFDRTEETPCLTQPTLQFLEKTFELLTKQNSEQMFNRQQVWWRIERAPRVALRDTQLVKDTQ